MSDKVKQNLSNGVSSFLNGVSFLSNGVNCNINKVNAYSLLLQHKIQKSKYVEDGLKILSDLYDNGRHSKIIAKIDEFLDQHTLVFKKLGMSPQDWLILTCDILDKILDRSNLFECYEIADVVLNKLLQNPIPSYVSIYVVQTLALVCSIFNIFSNIFPCEKRVFKFSEI